MPSVPASCPMDQRLLAQGQSLLEYMPRGTVIRVASGSVVLAQRTTLDYALLTHRLTLPRGAVHGVQVSGWLIITAQSDAELVLRVPAGPSLLPVWRALGRCLAHGWRGLASAWGDSARERADRTVA
jgi:hypothetical protein